MKTVQPVLMDVTAMSHWVAQTGVENIIRGIAHAVEREYARWERFDRIPRVASHTPIGVIELMPTSDGEEYSFKFVNGHPSNPARGYQTVTAFGALANVDNGYPTFLAEMTLLTALRTAATSAMAAHRLARPDSQVMGMIGAGSQSEFQALGMRGTLGINSLRIFDIDPAAVAKFQQNLEPLGFQITPVSDAAEACQDADIITTCTADKNNNIILDASMIPPGAHINAIGGDCPGKTELDSNVLEMGPVFVEFAPQTRIEGEIQQMPADFPVTEIWQVLTGEQPGRTDPAQVTIFDSVGFAISDFAALRFTRDSTLSSDLLQPIQLIADPEDPKDLFSLVKSPVRV